MGLSGKSGPLYTAGANADDRNLPGEACSACRPQGYAGQAEHTLPSGRAARRAAFRVARHTEFRNVEAFLLHLFGNAQLKE